jgi:hypothetical protein
MKKCGISTGNARRTFDAMLRRGFSPEQAEAADRTARRPADADHCELWSFVDLNRKAELVAVKFDRPSHVGYAKRHSL